jgi:transposase-like protein
MANIRKRHSREFKMKVVLDLLKGDKSLAVLSSEHGVHATQLKEWKEQALLAMQERFSTHRGRKKAGNPPDNKLYEEIGRLKVELDFLSGKLGH